MAANYLHGVETIEVNSGARPVNVVKAGVIGIIGTSAYIGRNQPYLITSPRQAAELLGPALREFTLRKHVDKIFEQGSATIVVVNVYDNDEHTSTITDEVKTITDGKFTLSTQIAPYYPPTVKSFDGNTTYTLDEDYTFDALGNFTVLNTDLLETDGTQVKVTYTRHALSLVNEAEVIGDYEPDGDRTGLKCFELVETMFGFKPKMLLAPVFCETQSMVDALISLANQLRARALVDGVMDNVQEAITARGPLGAFNFKTGSRRAVLCWPKREVSYEWGEESIGLATILAGVWSNTINTDGYWFSPSNREFLGGGSPEVEITGSINDATGEANLLNEKGIVCHLNMFGSGPRIWGNRSAAFPTSTAPDNFLQTLLTADVIDESIELAMAQFIDRPITDATIDSIKGTVQQFLNTLIGRGAVLPGSQVIYDPAENPTTELAAGHLTFDNSYMVPPPAERISFKRYIATELLSNLQTV